MKSVIRFDLDGRRVSVAADSFQQAIALLCSMDYFDGWEESSSLDWGVVPADEVLRVHYRDDPLRVGDEVPEGLTWDEPTKYLSGSASAWAKASTEAEVIADSEY